MLFSTWLYYYEYSPHTGQKRKERHYISPSLPLSSSIQVHQHMCDNSIPYKDDGRCQVEVKCYLGTEIVTVRVKVLLFLEEALEIQTTEKPNPITRKKTVLEHRERYIFIHEGPCILTSIASVISKQTNEIS